MRRLYDTHHVNASRVQAKWTRVCRATRPQLTDRSIIANIGREDLGKSMRYDDNHKERTRARVLAEAAAAIRGKGVERVGVAEVMAGAGLTHGGFYAHFKSKDDLLTEAISYMFDDAYAAFLRPTEGRSTAVAFSNRLRRRQVDANPAEFARDGSIAPRPRSTDITRGVTAPDALTRGSSLSHVRHGVGLPTGPRSDIR